MERSPAVALLNSAMKRYEDIPGQVSVFATSGVGPRLSLRERRYEITPERAGRPFRSSMVFVAPHLATFPYEDITPVLRALDANPSLTLTESTDELLVYTSTDMDADILGRKEGPSSSISF